MNHCVTFLLVGEPELLQSMANGGLEFPRNERVTCFAAMDFSFNNEVSQAFRISKPLLTAKCLG